MVDKPKLDQMLSNLKQYVGVRARLPPFRIRKLPDAPGQRRHVRRAGRAVRARRRVRRTSRCHGAVQEPLVHLYRDVEDRRVFACLQDSLGDLEEFAQAVARHPW